MSAFVPLLVVSLCSTAFTLLATRRRVLREHAAVLWVGVSLVMVALTCTLPFHLVDHFAHDIGIKQGSDLVFLMGMLFVLLLLFQMSIALTRLQARSVRLVQEVALLRTRVEAVERAADTDPSGTDSDGSAVPSHHV